MSHTYFYHPSITDKSSVEAAQAVTPEEKFSVSISNGHHEHLQQLMGWPLRVFRNNENHEEYMYTPYNTTIHDRVVVGATAEQLLEGLEAIDTDALSDEMDEAFRGLSNLAHEVFDIDIDGFICIF